MAGVDYCSCFSCGARLFYDGDWSVREQMGTDYLICSKCHKKLIKCISRLEACRKRGRYKG